MAHKLPDHQAVDHLLRRLDNAERSAADARDRARLLLALQSTLSALAMLRDEGEIVATMLQALTGTLGFRRAIYAHSEQRAAEVKPYAVLPLPAIELDLRSSFNGAAPGRQGLANAELGDMRCGYGCGSAGDLDAPFVDVRSWFVATRLRSREGAIGTLYADDSHAESVDEWTCQLVAALGTVGAVALHNARLVARMTELASRDPLTGLLNRRAFQERLDDELDRSRRHGRSATFVMIDVDDFKRVNDTYGHSGGDDVLVRIARTLAEASRAEDVVARFAGDEFVIVLVDVDPILSRSLVGRISSALRSAGLSCSLGAADFPRDASSAAALLIAADTALYATKAAGKNGYSFATYAP